MNKKNWSNILSVLARTALAFVFVFGQTAWAMQAQTVKDKPTSNAAAKSKQAPGNPSTVAGAKSQSTEEGTATEENSSNRENSQQSGQHESIKVHGHWTIEVRSPVGELVTHREFENALDSFGGRLLAQYLARTVTVGQWNVALIAAPTTFYIDEPGPAASAPNPGTVIGVLTVSVSPNGTLVLSGSGTAPISTTITSVFSQPSACAPAIAPSMCNVASGNESGASLGTLPYLTSATLASPVSVIAGQTIAVTVNITFS
jgi:hypothetical protein